MPYVHPDDYADTFHNATAEQEREADLPPPETSEGVEARLGLLAETALRIKAERDALEALVERLPKYLAERAAWLKYEADNGGDRAALGAQERECRYLIKVLTNGRYREDGRPSWLVSRIKVPALEQSIAAINGEKGI